MDEDKAQGPIMLVATNMLRPPQARIGKITKDIVLPRTVSVLSLVAGGAGLIIGMIFALPFRSFEAIMVGAALGTTIGIMVVTMSPIKGESFGKWLGLSVASARAEKVTIDGLAAKVYIGIAPLHYTAAGPMRMKGGAVNVTPGSVDERGVFIPQEVFNEERRQRAEHLKGLRGRSWPTIDPSQVKHLPKDGVDKEKKSNAARRGPLKEAEGVRKPLPKQGAKTAPVAAKRLPASAPQPSGGQKKLPASKTKSLKK